MEHSRNIQLEILQNESGAKINSKKSFTIMCDNCGKKIIIDDSYTYDFEGDIDLYAKGDDSVYIYCSCGNSVLY